MIELLLLGGIAYLLLSPAPVQKSDGFDARDLDELLESEE
jgi:hypothetical protein